MKELTDEQLEKLKKADTSELVQIMARVKASGRKFAKPLSRKIGRGFEIGGFASEQERQRRQVG